MKRTVKMILALALALTMICALGTAAFADNDTVVTKNPTGETHYVGETATFIANAVNYESIEWMFIAPNGTAYSLDAFKAQFPASGVTGQGTTELKITNLQTGMNGWEVYCGFNRGNICTTTTAASISVLVPSAPVYSAPATVVTDPVYVPCYEYEPDYVVVDGVRVYSDGTVVSDDDTPVFIDSDGTNYYTDGTVITPDCAPGYYWVNGVLVYVG
ncbi:MAG: hypothetical protein IJV51_01220 [Oscillospiraceae bacterium]|nr:hypothetical protein [Oscillospiraceae bacterium]